MLLLVDIVAYLAGRMIAAWLPGYRYVKLLIIKDLESVFSSQVAPDLALSMSPVTVLSQADGLPEQK